MLIRLSSLREAGTLLKRALRGTGLYLRRTGWRLGRKLLALVLIETMAFTSVANVASASRLPLHHLYQGILPPLPASFLNKQFNRPQAKDSAKAKTPPAQVALLKKPELAPPAHSLLQSSPIVPVSGLAISVGFADNSSATSNFPVPWQGSANTVFLGGGTSFQAGAIRLDNPSAADINVDKVQVDLGRPGPVFQLWSNFVVPANGSVILTQTAENSFNTSAASPLVGCGQTLAPSETRIPQITVTIAGTDAAFADTAHVLDTGGFDSSCRGNQSLAWRPLGTTGPERPAATLHLSSANAPHEIGTNTTFTAILTDAADQPLANTSVVLAITSGPNSGKSLNGATDSSGTAELQYTSAIQGVDSAQAVISNASSGNMTSETAQTSWISSEACTAPSASAGASRLTYIGQTSGSFGDSLRIAGLLTDGTGQPLSSRTVTLAIGGNSSSTLTDSNGVAAITVTPGIGQTLVSMSFAGDANASPAQLSTSITIQSKATLLRYLGNNLLGSAGPQTVSARLTDSLGQKPVVNRTVTFAVGANQASALTDANGVASTSINLPSTQPSGPAQLAINFAGDQDYKASSRVVAVELYLATSFVIWGGNAGGLKIGQDVNFWGNQWSQQVTSGNFSGAASFKGWADPIGPVQQCQPNATTSTLVPGCWQSVPGQSSPPPLTLPSFIQVIVATAGAKPGTSIFGNMACPAVLKVDANPSYQPDPGHPGFGVITAVNGDCVGVFPKPAILNAQQTQPTPVLPSQSVNVKVAVQNSGATDATNVSLTESFDGLVPPSDAQSFATIPAGQSINASFLTTVPAIPARQGSETSSDYITRLGGLDGRFFTASGELAFTDVFQQLYQPLDFSSFSTMQIPRLTVAINGPACIVPGSQVPYQIGVNNIGSGTAASGSAAVTLPDATAQNVAVPQILPAASFVSTVQWHAPVIPAKDPAETTANYLARLAAADNITVSPLTASVTWLDALNNSYGAVDQQFSSVKQRLPILSMTSTPPATVLPNQAATLNFAVTNTGGGNAVQANILVQRQAAATITVPPFSLPSGQSAAIVSTLRLPAIPLEGAQETDAQYLSRLQALDSQKISLDGSLSWTDKSANVYGPTSNPFSTTQILPILTIALTGPTTAKPGDTISYTISLQNVGHADAAAVNIALTLPDGSVQHPLAGSGLVAGGAAQTTVSFLVPSTSSSTITAKVRLSWTDAAGNLYGFESATASSSVAAQSPSIADFTPKTGPAGTAVSITGTNLTNPSAPTTVTFSGPNGTQVAAKINFASAAQLAVVVPDTAVTGPITVTTPTGSVSTAVPFVVGPRQDFQVTVSPGTATLPQVSSTAFVVALTSPQTTFTQLASLSVTGLPLGALGSFNPPQITAGANSTFSVNLSATDLQPGVYSFTIHASAVIDGKSQERTAAGKLNVVAAGQTTLAGQVLSTANEPIVGASVSLDGQTVLTDGAGRFLLVGVQAGTNRPLSVDGHTAFSPNATFPLIFEPATIIAGRANIIQRPFNLPPIDTSQEVTIDPTRDTVAGNAAVANLQMTVPKGANLRMLDGTLVTRTSITPLAPDRTPAPLPSDVGTNIVYTSQPGGAITDIPIPVVYPNLAGLDPGTRVELYAFDHAHVNWFVYGFGRVSTDGRTIAPEINPATGKPYGLPDFSWHFPNTGPNGNPSDPNGCPKSQGANPVDYSTGMKIERVPQVSWGGARGGLVFSLIYTTDKAQNCDNCPFGRGWTHNWDIKLSGSFAPGGAGRLIMPDQVTGRLFNSSGTDSSGAPKFTTTATTTQLGSSIGVGVLFRGSPTTQYRDPDGTLLNFDSSGRLVSKVDANGNTTTLEYSSGRLAKITDPVGRSLTFSYDGAGRISSMTDPLNRTWHYTYEGTPGVAGNPGLTTITDPAGNVTKYGYVTGGRVASVTDPRGNVIKQVTYDVNGRVASQTFADGGTETYNYALSGTVVASTTVMDPLGRTQTRRFNANGYVIGITDASGQTATIQRDLTTNVAVSVVGACGCTQRTRGFTAAGDVSSSANAVGGVMLRNYEPTFHVVTTATDPLGHVTSYTYDQNGKLLSKKDALGQITSYGYDSFGELTSITDASGSISRIEYDAHGNVNAAIDPALNQRSFEYDLLGRATAIVDPLGRRTTMQYSDLGRLVSVTEPNGNVTRYEYDAAGNRTAIVNPLNKRWTYAYDFKNRMVARTDPLGNAFTYTYDQGNQLVSVKTPLGRITRYTYTDRGQKASVTLPNGESALYVYDASGHLVKVTDARGNSISYGYDAGGRLINRTDPSGSTSTISYDSAGNITARTDRFGRQTTFVYDALNRPLQVNYPDGAISYTYDPIGHITDKTDSAGGAIHWTYDDAGRLISEVTDKATVSYSYNAAGQVISAGIQGRQPAQYQYDDFGRLNSISFGGRNFLFQYDAASRRSAVIRPNGITSSYGYDDGNRLVHISHANSAGAPIEDLAYNLDADGRIVSIQSANNHVLLPGSTNVSTADANNRISQFGTSALSYDSQGQLIGKTASNNTTTYDWDSRGRIVATHLRGGSTLHYSYDALGRLASRDLNGTKTDYVYSGTELIFRHDSSGDDTDFVNGTFGPERLLQTGPGGDLYFLQDHISNVISITGASGSMLEQESYEPFGNGPGSSLTEYGFIGERLDPDSHLLNLNARFYDPALQRFITEDPIGATGGLNAFAYTDNDPINRLDPSGLYWCGYDWLSCASNMSAGAGDKLSFGLTNWIRDKMGINDVVDKCGLGYQVGGYIGDTVNYSIQALTLAGPFLEGGALAAETIEAAEAIETEEGLASATETADELAAARAEQLAENRAAGEAFEQRLTNYAESELENVENQVSIRPLLEDGTPADFRVRVDTVGTEPGTGDIQLLEGKASETAPLTPNQQAGYPLIQQNGGIVVGNGGGAAYPAGTVIPPTPVQVFRPSSLPPPF